MNNLYVVVEGPSEQTFIREILSPFISQSNIFLHPVLIGKPGHKGGDVRFDRAKEDIGNLLKQRTDIYVTTMFDYFRIDSDWPGMEIIRQKSEIGTRLTTEEKANEIEKATAARIAEIFSGYDAKNRFLPYIEMHEFESLLFSDSEAISRITEIPQKSIDEILNLFGCPEDINDAPEGAPSKRLIILKNDYRKVAMGKAIAELIGVPRIREQCPHFDGWIRNMERIARI